MSKTPGAAVDEYLGARLIASDPILEQALHASEAAGLPSINVTPNQGKLLQLLARGLNACKILEIGTLGGYSTIWLARALPEGGRLVTLEIDPLYAQVARLNVERAGLASVVELHLGAALETLPKLVAAGAGPFDLIFIDADKQNSSAYFEWSLRLARPGSMIIVDNVIRDGAIIDANSADDRVHGVRKLFESLANDTRVSATAIQTVGSKGYDGLAFVHVLRT
jgi:predicted O-methyltransferase YrrM